MPDRFAIKVANGHRLYMAKLNMGNSNYMGVLMFTHEVHYDDQTFQDKVRKACQIVLDSRIKNRREEMAAQKVPIHDPTQTNETLFQGDLEFFEAVMIDQFQFRKVMYSVCEWKIDPTVLI